jgi:RNA polymerase sigma-70 factor, ECF subfamily
MDDDTAIGRSLQGDRQAFRSLVERYERQALARAMAITGDLDTAREAAQEAFVDAWRHLERFDRGRPFYPWLQTLLRHRCFKQLAGRPRVDPEHEREVAEPVAPDQEQRPDLERALAALDPADRELVLLKHLGGMTYAELGARLGIPPGTVMSRLFHARRRLKDLLEPATLPPPGSPR